jgi:hypothetical protein
VASSESALWWVVGFDLQVDGLQVATFVAELELGRGLKHA